MTTEEENNIRFAEMSRDDLRARIEELEALVEEYFAGREKALDENVRLRGVVISVLQRAEGLEQFVRRAALTQEGE